MSVRRREFPGPARGSIRAAATGARNPRRRENARGGLTPSIELADSAESRFFAPHHESTVGTLGCPIATPRPPMRLFVRCDLDGFFGLALDNLVQLLLIDSLCRYVVGFPDELLYGRVLPGVAVSLLVGNLFYAWQAHRLAARTGRSDVTALPYGINTPSVVAFVFLVMLPAKGDALKAGARPAAAAEAAWRMGLVACLGRGLIELLGWF